MIRHEYHMIIRYVTSHFGVANGELNHDEHNKIINCVESGFRDLHCFKQALLAKEV